MTAEHPPVELVRWRWILPVLLVIMTAILQAQGWYDWQTSDHRGGMGNTPIAGSVAFILSAPAFFLDNLTRFSFGLDIAETDLDLWLLMRVATLWWWIGWLLDARHRCVNYSRGYRIGWTCIYLVLGCASAALAWEGTRNLRWMGWHRFVLFIGELGLRATTVTSFFASVWFVIGAVYFAGRTIKLWRSCPHESEWPVRRFNLMMAALLVIGGFLGWANVRFDYSRLYAYSGWQTVGTVRGCIVGAVIGWTWEFVRRRRLPSAD